MDADGSAIRVLFVCLGNICRSPMAEGVFRGRATSAGLSDQIIVDSAGTGAWHIGNPPDPRGQAAAARRGIDLSGQRARQIRQSDFTDFDYIVAMDQSNKDTISQLSPPDAKAQLHLFLDFAPSDVARSANNEVPDPYYGGDDGFEVVLDLIEAASDGLLAYVSSSTSGARLPPSGNTSTTT